MQKLVKLWGECKKWEKCKKIGGITVVKENHGIC
jgi:hypothetical protein